MSAIRIDAIEVDVTHSDCIADNQIGNSQNYTKTYFVSSDQDFSSFSHFFGNAIYKVRRGKIVAYKALMHELYDGRFAQYQGKGAAFDASFDFLNSPYLARRTKPPAQPARNRRNRLGRHTANIHHTQTGFWLR